MLEGPVGHFHALGVVGLPHRHNHLFNERSLQQFPDVLSNAVSNVSHQTQHPLYHGLVGVVGFVHALLEEAEDGGCVGDKRRCDA